MIDKKKTKKRLKKETFKIQFSKMSQNHLSSLRKKSCEIKKAKMQDFVYFSFSQFLQPCTA